MTEETTEYILAIDPGREKLGVAIIDRSGDAVEKRLIVKADFPGVISDFIRRYNPEIFAVGDGTGSGWVLDILNSLGTVKVVAVPEAGTTLEARELAWKVNPPGGIFRILPRIFWPDPPELDAWAAVVIGRRAIASLTKRPDGNR